MNTQEKQEMSYESAWSELQQIVADLQSGNVGMDDLSSKLDRVSELVQFCRQRLRATEDAVGRLGQ